MLHFIVMRVDAINSIPVSGVPLESACCNT